ncbi:putative membrane-associated kinase regulator 4 [Heracleum sosnowskyi]|uniref:Membrane-associated kinase regulator 4 n=1 Tax=Heracleum sosnowskyi TaxID=360622 RepID=A0AAD8NA26_9APIA|nr:putative membrane-associated kinase regulator 4 [Heracleum sosnowskyi]
MKLMASTNLPFYNHAEDMYIDMELSCSSTSVFFSSPQARDFEFQMCDFTHLEKETITSPADELFYKGKLLPLHLPPRLEMVEKLLQTTKNSKDDQQCSIVLASTTNTTPSDQSCNISPSESCRVSCELNPADYFEWSSELSGFVSGTDQPKKSWSKYKLKLIKQSCLGQKLKASRAYLKSLFSKSGSDKSSVEATCNDEDSEHVTKGNKDYFRRYIKVAKKSPYGQLVRGMKIPTLVSVMSSFEKDGFDQDNNITTDRKSFSGTKQRPSTIKSSTSSGASSLSSSFSFYSNGVYETPLLKRSNSATSEIESSIEAAIAYCKKSQQLFTTRNTVNEAGFCSFSVSRIVA